MEPEEKYPGQKAVVRFCDWLYEFAPDPHSMTREQLEHEYQIYLGLVPVETPKTRPSNVVPFRRS